MLKTAKTKFLECPVSAVTKKTWRIIGIVNETTNAEGDIIQLPFSGALTEQPQWYRDAVQIIKSERSLHRQAMMDKANGR